MISGLRYEDAFRSALENVCQNCGSSLIVTPVHLDEGEFGLICSMCREALHRLTSLTRLTELPAMPSIRKVRLFWSHALIIYKADAVPNFDVCWNWMSSRDAQPSGYGYFRGDDRVYRSHRYAYLISNPAGSDLTQRVVAHTCDNPPCVNVSHLKNSSYRDNFLDVVYKNRTKWLKMDVTRAMQLYQEAQRGVPTKIIAEKYGISEWMVCGIKTGKCWSWATGKTRTYHQRRLPKEPQSK